MENAWLLRPQLYGLGEPASQAEISPSICGNGKSVSATKARVTLAEVTFSLHLCNLHWVRELVSRGETTLAARQVDGHLWARLTGTTLGVANVTQCLDLGFKVEIRIKEVKINTAKPTVIELARGTKRGIFSHLIIH